MIFWRVLYEVLIILVVLTYAILIVAEPGDHPFLTPDVLRTLDYTLIGWFAVEYLLGFSRAAHKGRFVRKHWLDLIAMIPVEAFFPLARLLRVFRLVRMLQESPFLWSIISSREMRFIFIFIGVVLLWGSAGMFVLEYGVNPNVQSFGDALWWAMVTTATVGYGDISPVTEGGRMIAAFLMIAGIGLISTLTANLANHSMTFFDNIKLRYQMQAAVDSEEDEEELSDNRLHLQMKEQVMHQLHHVETLTDAEYRTLLKMIQLLRDSK